MVQLWPFQIEAKEILRDHFMQGVLSQILYLPTGAGKTEVAMSIVEGVVAKGKSCWFIVDRQTLVQQTSDRFKKAGIGHGMQMGAASHTSWSPIQVMCAPTLERRGFDAYPRPALVIMDECHAIRKAVVQWIKKEGIRMIGLSATPLTPGLDEWYEKIVNVTNTKHLIGKGYLAPLKVVGPVDDAIIDTDGVPLSGGEWNKEALSDRVLKIVGEIVPTWKTNTDRFFGGPVQTIVFCPSVPDSCKTAEKFRDAGYDFQAIHYKQSAAEKHAIIERFRNEEHMGLISCIALTRGFDVPGTRCLVDAYPLRASIKQHIQKIGRVMRIAEGKDFGLFINHAGNWERFSHDTNHFFAHGCSEFVQKQKSKKKKTYDLVPATRMCLGCRIYLDPTEYKCPECGQERLTKRDATIARYGGHMDLVAELIGPQQLDLMDRDPTAKGDLVWWWKQIRAAVYAEHPSNHDRARKKALATFRSIFGEWPPSPYREVKANPHPAALELVKNSFEKWKHSQRAA